MNDNVAIRVQGVSKSFKLPHEKSGSIKSMLLGMWKRRRGYEIQHVLKDISLEINKGDFFGIVGRNGSGKSTLLKLISQIYMPDKGTITVNGKLTPFIELGVGFNPELSGRDNVYLNGALLGFNRQEMDAIYDEIVEFAELERFMDQKLKNYSSGMQVRLAFSIAIRADSDILVLDEVLAVGDEVFQRKCFGYFAELKRNKKTVILVTHSMNSVQQFCTKAMLIDKGHKTEIGKPLEIAQIYRELNDEDEVTVNKDDKAKSATGTKYVKAQVKCVKSREKITFDIAMDPKMQIDDPVVAIGVYRDTGEPVYRWASDERLPFAFDIQKHKKIRIEVDNILPVGVFTVDLFIKKRDRSKDYAVFNRIAEFEIKNVTPYEHAILWNVPDQIFVNGEEVVNVH